MTAISYHDTVNDLHGLGLSGKGPFARADWFALLEARGGSPVFVLARDDTGAIALPLDRQGKIWRELTNWYAFTWQPLISGSPAPATWAELAGSVADLTTRIEMHKLPDEAGMATCIEAAFHAGGWCVFREPCDTNHFLELRGRTYAEYLSARPGKLRTTLKRKAGKVDIVLSRQYDDAQWALYQNIYRASWKPEEGDEELLRSFARAQSAAGNFLFGMARLDGKPVAAQFWTVEEGTAYIHKLAHLPEAQGLSPGTTLTAALLAEVIGGDKVDFVDFGTGDDRYKADWMEAVRPRWKLTCLHPKSPSNWPQIVKTKLRNLVSRPTSG